jgi:NADH dehydrogenase FAD-containing subunit
MSDATALIVGGGFAGVTCAQQLAKPAKSVRRRWLTDQTPPASIGEMTMRAKSLS